MAMDYVRDADHVIEKLRKAHSRISRFRKEFFEIEFGFFEKHIRNQSVLVAGSGLGHDSFELAHYNTSVVGIEIVPTMIELAQEEAVERGIRNVKFICSDFTKLNYSDCSFDSAVLNMGTIGNLGDPTAVLKGLPRVAKRFYFDYYLDTPLALELRRMMYQGVEWRDIRIEGKTLVNNEGLYSRSFFRNELRSLAKKAGTSLRFFPLCGFAEMVVAEKLKEIYSTP